MKKSKSTLPGHTGAGKMPSGEYQGHAIPNKIGKSIDVTLAGRMPMKKMKKPKTLA